MEEIKWEHLTEVLNRYGELLAVRYKSYVPEASGKLVQSVKYEFKHNDRIYEVGLWLEDYWKYVEYGRKAGKFPPIDKIKEWISVKPVKPVIPRPMKNGKLPTINQLAFLIARKIAREGIEPKNILKRTVEEVNNEMLMSIKMAIMEDLKRDITESLVTLNNLKS